MWEDIEEVEVLRHHNRALRRVHKKLRSAQKIDHEYSDMLFLELCNTDTAAQTAMEKLWTLGGVSDKCGPQDYNKIVELLLEKLNVTIPIDQS